MNREKEGEKTGHPPASQPNAFEPPVRRVVHRLQFIADACTLFEPILRVADVPEDISLSEATMRALGTSLGLAMGEVFGEERADSMARVFVEGLFDP